MKSLDRFTATIVFLLLGSLSLAACITQRAATPSATDDPQITAINNIRNALDLPNLPLEFKGMADMANARKVGTLAALYVDREGRKYSVDPQTNIVVEIDARDLLSSIPPDAPVMSQAEISAKVKNMLAIAIPDFASLTQNLTYEDGGKIDNYFFSWYGNMSPGDFNRPFIQVGIYKTGFIFAYYNTISMK